MSLFQDRQLGSVNFGSLPAPRNRGGHRLRPSSLLIPFNLLLRVLLLICATAILGSGTYLLVKGCFFLVDLIDRKLFDTKWFV